MSPLHPFLRQHDIELILFDCDGVLVDSVLIGNRVVHQELQRLGHSLTLLEYMEVGVGHRKEEQTALLAQRGIVLPAHFWEGTDEKILAAFNMELQPIAGIKEVLSQLRLKKCIASSSYRKRLDLSLRVTGLHSYFKDLIFSGEMVAQGKPDPAIFLLAAQTLGVVPERCLVIEDSLAGIRAGQAAGMCVWGFVGGEHCSPEYIETIKASNPDLVFSAMHELLFPS